MMRYTSFFILLFVILSCNRETLPEETQDHPANTVVLTPQQFAAAGIKTARPEKRTMRSIVRATGRLDVPPQNIIDIAAPMGGFVKRINLQQGMAVKKGDVLAVLEHPDYIQLQQDYLQARSELGFLEAEYERQRRLSAENVNAEKKLQQSRADYESTRAVVQGLAAKLALINIDPEKLVEEGIKPVIQLYAPLTGFITDVNVNTGKYVSAADVISRLVSTAHMHVELQVFEQDIARIKAGQRIQFRLPGHPETWAARVYLIGKAISTERTVLVHGHLEQENPDLLPGMFVSATIESESTEADAVPEEAIVLYRNEPHVFTVSDSSRRYTLIPVETGITDNGYTAITWKQKPVSAPEVVVSGAYTLLSVMLNMEAPEE